MKKTPINWLRQRTGHCNRRQWICFIVLFSIAWTLGSGWLLYHSFYHPAILTIDHFHPPLPKQPDSLLLLEKIYQQKHPLYEPAEQQP